MKLWEALKAFDEGKEVEFRLKTSLGVDGWHQVKEGHIFVTGKSDYEFRIKPRPPGVVEFVLDCRKYDPADGMDRIDYDRWCSLKGRRWRIVATEIIEGEG